jgi:molybdopterin converting factor small subunit
MAKTEVVFTKPVGGVAARPQALTCEAESARDALLEAEAEAGISVLRGADALRPGATVFVNGADLRLEGGLERPLADGDVLAIVLPITDT